MTDEHTGRRTREIILELWALEGWLRNHDTEAALGFRRFIRNLIDFLKRQIEPEEL